MFKVGDKVKRIEEEDEYSWRPILNTVYIVTEVIIDFRYIPSGIRLYEDPHKQVWDVSCFELVKPKRYINTPISLKE